MTNISDIQIALENLNATIDINGTTILNNAIEQSNTQSDGWSGLLIYGIIGVLIYLYLNKNKNEFKLNNEINLLGFSTLIIGEIGLILYQYRLIYNIQPVVFILTIFITISIFSLLKKERDTFA